MALFKTTQIFEATEFISGWSETWYVNAADNTTAMNQAQLIATARATLLSSDHRIKFIRATPNVPTLPPPVSRRARRASLLRVDIQGTQPPATQGDLPFVSVLARVSDSALQVSRLQHFRGVPDTFWDFESDKIARAKFNPFQVTMVNALKQNSAFILHKQDAVTLVPVAIANMQFERMGSRKIGRPFGLLRGRR